MQQSQQLQKPTLPAKRPPLPFPVNEPENKRPKTQDVDIDKVEVSSMSSPRTPSVSFLEDSNIISIYNRDVNVSDPKINDWL